MTLDQIADKVRLVEQNLADLARIPQDDFDTFASTVGRAGPIIGFRNRVVHLYDRVDPQIVFRILREQRGDLRDLLRLLVEQLPPEG